MVKENGETMNGKEKDEKAAANRELYFLLGEINGKLDGLVDQLAKVIYALIALAGATVGLKLMGTPPMQVIMYYIKAFILLFTVLMTFAKRRVLKGWGYLFAFGFFAGTAQIMNIVLSGEVAVATMLYLVSNASLLRFLWNWDGWNKSNMTSVVADDKSKGNDVKARADVVELKEAED